jgi:protein-tyrosine phosphatase
MIDLHSHVLPGIDDGPATMERSVALARAAVSAGTLTLLATPHVSARYPNDATTIADLLDALAARLREENVALELRRGAEIAITRIAEIDPSELHRLGLGGGRWLLVEPPFSTVATGIEGAVRDLLQRGHRVLLAHPERCPAFHRDPRVLESLVGDGVLTSITAGSLVGRFGGEVRRFALRLLDAELAHNVASDAHDHEHRPPTITDELVAAGLGPLRDWLTHEVPAAILADEVIPHRPPVQRARSGSSRWPRWHRRGG